MLQVSFFSYKGGAGRTSMLFNTASYLADELGATPDEPIVIIDLDLDSKGLSFLLRPEYGTEGKLNAVQVLTNADVATNVLMKSDEFFKMMIPIF